MASRIPSRTLGRRRRSTWSARRIDLDRRTAGVAGAARTSPHSLVQEFLNRSDDHLWGFVSNGLRLRILRDNVSLTRQAYVEFDLEAMMDGEVYADFVLLWLLCHQSRVEGERPEQCWLEKWSQPPRQNGTRALDHAARRRRGRDRGPRPRLPGPSRQCRAPREARDCGSKAVWTRRTTTASCCGWSTGCCSCSWPRIAACC